MTSNPMMAVMTSSASVEWYTPRHILDAVTAVLGPIELDPCSNPPPYNVPAARHYTEPDMGLLRSWQAATIFMNPPYGDEIGAWVRRLLGAYQGGAVAAAIALVPGRVDTRWFQPLFDYPICFVAGRLHFGDAKEGAPFPSAVVYLGPDLPRFLAVFGPLGRIARGIELKRP